MSGFYSLTKEQQAYLMQVAHQTFPTKSLPQQQARITISKEKEHQEQQSHYEYLPDDDNESDQLYHSDEESEKDDDNRQEIQVSSLETS